MDDTAITPIQEQTIVHGEENVILSIDNLSKSHAASIITLTEEIKKTSEMLNDGLANDSQYKQLSDSIRDLQKERLARKAQIMKIPGNVDLSNKLKSLKQERKDKQLSLSDYLLELEKMTGVNQLELFTGEVFEIRKSAKLVKAKGSK